MKLRNKGYFVGILLLVISIFSYVSLKEISPLLAADKNYSLELGDLSSEDKKAIPVKLTINNPKNEELTFNATGLAGISAEDFLEGKTDSDLSTSSIIDFSKDSFTIKMKESKKPLVVQFFVRTFAGNEAKNGHLFLSNKSGEVAELSFELPKIAAEKEVKQVEKSVEPLAAFSLSEYAAVPVNEKSVSTWTDFASALADSTVDKITLAANLSATTNPSLAARSSLEIDGQGYQIDFTATTGRSINMAQGSATGSVLTVKNLKYTGNNTTAIFNASAANSSNWTVNFDTITTLTGNSRPLIAAVNSVVSITGKNVLNIVRATNMITAKEVYIQGTESERATVEINDGGNFVNSTIANGKFLIENADLTVPSVATLYNVTGTTSQVDIRNATIAATTISNFIFGTSINTTISNSKIDFPNISANFHRNNIAGSSLLIDQKSDINITSTAAGDIIDASGTMAFTVDDSLFNANTVGQIFSNSAAGTDMNVQNKATFTGYSRSNNAIRSSAQIDITVKNDGTTLNLSGNSTQTADSGGIISIAAANSTLNVEDKAYFKIHSLQEDTATPAVMIQSSGGSFNASGESILDMISEGQSNAYAATVRFRLEGNMSFNVSGKSQININKMRGGAPGIRMYGENNNILVSENSDFTVHNVGTGSAQAPGADNRGQGIIFYQSSASGPHSFTLKDPGSRVKIWAENGAGIDTWRPNTVSATEGTYFEVIGNTSSGAIFNTYGSRDLTFILDKPMYYDFRNNGGKALMSPGSASTFQSIHSDVSFWIPKSGEPNYGNDGNPFRAWTLLDYSLNGANMLLNTTSDPTFNTNTDSFGNSGINRFSRMSGNNANPIVDEIRTPTNADKFIYGHVSIPEGKDGFRDAWTDEVHVELEVKLPNDSVAHKIYGTTVQDGETGKYSIYGETARAGMFKADMSALLANGQEFIPAETEVKVIRAWRGSSDVPQANDSSVHIGSPDDPVHGDLWATETVTSKDVTPPTQAVVTTDLTNAVKQLTGTSDENGAKVFVKVNGAWLKDASDALVTTVVNDGKWVINLPNYVTKNDTVDIYLKDSTTIDPVPAFTLPKTYTTEPDGINGNINEEVTDYDSYLGYHDAVKSESGDKRFNSAKRLTAKDVIPDQPTLLKSVESSGGTSTSVGDTLTYKLMVGNAKNDSADWKNVQIVDVLAEGLEFDPAKNKVTVNNVEVGADKYTYDKTSRTLTIQVGDLSKNTEIPVTFQVTVGQSAVDKDLKNNATAHGDSPQEDPFVPGPVNPDATHKQIEVTSNEIGLPGGPAFGVLTFVSAPTALNFGVKTESLNGKTIADNPQIVGEPLVVSDNRGNLQKWTMTATLLAPLANGDAIFPDAIHYVNDDSDEVITGLSKQIFSHKNEAVGEYNISEEEWVKKGNGFKIELEPGAVNKLGKYQATIQFSLSDTP